ERALADMDDDEADIRRRALRLRVVRLRRELARRRRGSGDARERERGEHEDETATDDPHGEVRPPPKPGPFVAKLQRFRVCKWPLSEGSQTLHQAAASRVLESTA